MTLRNLVTTGGTCLRNTIFRRCLSLTPRTLGGGHHAPIPEPYVPKPRDTSERDWLGRRKLPRLSKDSHDHTMDDYQSYFGGVVFVLLTLGAVAFYTDVFGMNIKKDFKHAHHREVTTPKQAESTHSHSEEPEKPKPKPAAPVVQEKPAEKKTPEATDKVVEAAGSSKEKADEAVEGSKTAEPAAQNSESQTESSSEAKETTSATDEQKNNESTPETKHDDSQKPPCHDKPAEPKPESSNSEST